MKLAQEVLLAGANLKKIKMLMKAGYVDESLNITEKGERILLRYFVFNEYLDEMVARAKEVVESKEEKS